MNDNVLLDPTDSAELSMEELTFQYWRERYIGLSSPLGFAMKRARFLTAVHDRWQEAERQDPKDPTAWIALRPCLEVNELPGVSADPLYGLLLHLQILHERGFTFTAEHQFYQYDNAPGQIGPSYGLKSRITFKRNPEQSGPIKFWFGEEPYPTIELLTGDPSLDDYRNWCTTMLQLTTPVSDVLAAHQYISLLSENIFESSYNEDVIRKLWAAKELNQHIAGLAAQHLSFSTTPLSELWRLVYREDGNYQDALTSHIQKIRGWPIFWTESPHDLDPLTHREWALFEHNFVVPATATS